MSISLLGGYARGFNLKVLSSQSLRPTSVILRRKIFDRYQDLCDHTFVDACAGTGAMGLEACSRGADQIYLVEANKKFFQTLKDNVQIFEKKYSSEFEFALVPKLAKVQNWLEQFKQEYSLWDLDQRKKTIFFFDPPYAMKNLYDKVIIEGLIGEGWFQGDIWVESDRLKGYPLNFWEEKGISYIKSYEHSDSYIIVIENSH